MSLVDALTAQLRRDEGEKLHAYQDHLGFWTIGVGRLIDLRKGGGITPNESAFLLKNDIDRRLVQVRASLPWFSDLNEARQGVLLNMAFQLGVDGLLGFKTTLGLVQRGEYGDASAQMLLSKWAQQTPQRAYRLSKQMETGEWQ